MMGVPRDYETLERILRENIRTQRTIAMNRRGRVVTGTHPSLAEAKKAIKSMKPEAQTRRLAQTACPDEIPSELLKLVQYTVTKAMQ